MRAKNPRGGGNPSTPMTANECEGPGPTSYLRTFCIIMAVFETEFKDNSLLPSKIHVYQSGGH